MGKSRPINRRPWRRAPWKKNARPFRWISLNAGRTLVSTGVASVGWLFSPAATGGVQPEIVLAAGQTDVEPWADNQEITIDRIVGQVTVSGTALANFSEVPPALYAPAVEYRLGMLVQEEGDATSAPFINLFDDEHLEDFEWMWLYQGVPANWNYQSTSAAEVGSWGFTETIPLDLRVRRKLGQTDSLLLYAQYVRSFDANIASDLINIDGGHLLRSIFMSK